MGGKTPGVGGQGDCPVGKKGVRKERGERFRNRKVAYMGGPERYNTPPKTKDGEVGQVTTRDFAEDARDGLHHGRV